MVSVPREPTSRVLFRWIFWRQHTDLTLAGLGAWADYVKLSKRPLISFLSNPLVACEVDNQILRMLLVAAAANSGWSFH
jgi:hypothetical protein